MLEHPIPKKILIGQSAGNQQILNTIKIDNLSGILRDYTQSLNIFSFI
jgi:hypothetical protein